MSAPTNWLFSSTPASRLADADWDHVHQPRIGGVMPREVSHIPFDFGVAS